MNMQGLEMEFFLSQFCTYTILWLYGDYFWGFNVYIFVDLLKRNVLTFVSEIRRYGNYPCYYDYYIFRTIFLHPFQVW